MQSNYGPDYALREDLGHFKEVCVNVHPNGATHVRHYGAICGLNTALSYLLS